MKYKKYINTNKNSRINDAVEQFEPRVNLIVLISKNVLYMPIHDVAVQPDLTKVGPIGDDFGLSHDVFLDLID